MTVELRRGEEVLEVEPALLLQMLLGVDMVPHNGMAKYSAHRYLNGTVRVKSVEQASGTLRLVTHQSLFPCDCGRCGRPTVTEFSFREPLYGLDQDNDRCVAGKNGVTAVYSPTTVVFSEMFGPRIAISWADLFQPAVLAAAKNCDLDLIMEPVDIEKRQLMA